MRNLFDSSFFECVRESLRTSVPPAPNTLAIHYGDFSVAFTEAVEKEESTIVLFRYLRLIHIEICMFYKQMKESTLNNKSMLVTLLWKALKIVEVELDIVKIKIGQCGLAPPKPADATHKAPIFWSKEYTVTDLMELIVALYESGALVYRDGTRVSLVALVKLFESAFNIAIKDPRGLKSNVTGRKIKATKFLDILSANFIELCER
jgi:hypothetical protein